MLKWEWESNASTATSDVDMEKVRRLPREVSEAFADPARIQDGRAVLPWPWQASAVADAEGNFPEAADHDPVGIGDVLPD